MTIEIITIRVSTQVIEHFRDVAEVLQVPQNRVRVIGTYLGGGFGGKEDVTVEAYLGLLALETGRPVKMVWTRHESLLSRAKRHPYRLRYRTAANARGEIVAQQIELLADAGAYAYLSALVLLYSTVTAAGPYRVPAVEVDARVAYTNNPPTSAMRGFGAMQTVFAYESQMDGWRGRSPRPRRHPPRELAPARRHAAGRPGDRDARRDPGLVRAGVGRAWAADAAARAARARGRGLACNFQPYGRIVWLHDWASAWVGFENGRQPGRALRLPGRGWRPGVLALSDRRRGAGRVAGAHLGARLRQRADTAGRHDDGQPPALHVGQRGAHDGAGIARAALTRGGRHARRRRRRARHGQRRRRDARRPRRDRSRTCCASVRGPACRAAISASITRPPASPSIWPRVGQGVSGLHIRRPRREVEVDTETGVVRVLRYAAAHDVGARSIRSRSRARSRAAPCRASATG